jgi:hypothetical protein
VVQRQSAVPPTAERAIKEIHNTAIGHGSLSLLDKKIELTPILLASVFAEKAISKLQIMFKGKAWVDAKAQHTNVCEHFKEDHNTAFGH